MRELSKRFDRKQLVCGSIQQSALKTANFPEDRIGVVYRDHHVALRREILRQVSHERSRTRVAMGDHYEGEFLTRDRGGVAECLAGEIKRTRQILRACNPAGVDRLFFLPGGDSGRVPDFQLQGPVCERGLASPFIELQNIGLRVVHNLQGSDPHRQRTTLR